MILAYSVLLGKLEKTLSLDRGTIPVCLVHQVLLYFRPLLALPKENTSVNLQNALQLWILFT